MTKDALAYSTHITTEMDEKMGIAFDGSAISVALEGTTERLTLSHIDFDALKRSVEHYRKIAEAANVDFYA